MKRILQTAAIAVAALASTAQAQSYQTGLADLTIADGAGQRDLDGFLWYPTKDTAGAAEFHGNPVWRGIEAIADAAPAPGSHPLVVLSHGMYGNAMNQSWLASALAGRGYVVAAISHPGTSTWKRDPDDARRLWERPKWFAVGIPITMPGINAANISTPKAPPKILVGSWSTSNWTPSSMPR